MKALLIIDMIVRDVKNRKDKVRLISNQLKLIKAFRRAKQKVILAGGSKSGKPQGQKNQVMLRLWGNEESRYPEKNKIISELLETNYDLYIHKKEYSAFFKTRLEAYCKKNRIKEIYLCGIYSGCCVYFTAADAAMRRIQPYLVTDASGSVSQKRHNKNIKNFKDILGPVVSARTVLKKL